MSLRRRIMLLVAIGLTIATVPLGVVGIGMLRAATDRILAERLAMVRATAEHLSWRLTVGWGQLEQLSRQAALLLRAGDTAAVRAAVKAAAPQMPLFSGGLFILDASSRLVARDVPATSWSVRTFPTSPAAGRPLITRQPAVSGLVRSTTGTPMIIFTVPIFGAADAALGVVGGVINLSDANLQAFVDGLAVGSSGHAAIVDEHGTVLASTDPAELFTHEEHSEFFIRLISEKRTMVGSADDPRRPGGSADAHVMAFAPLAAVPWGLAVGQDEEETFGPVRRLRNRVILFGVALLGAALLFAWVDTGAVAAPLRLLKDAAERIAGGDLARRVEVLRTDEIGALARSFEAMRVQLLRSLEENARLQEQVLSVAVLEERERIAREMHDNVGQVLGYVNTKAQAVKVLLETGKIDEAGAHLVQLDEAAREVYADLREAILGLRTEVAPARRLIEALREYVHRFGELSGITTEMVVEGDPARYAFSPTTELHLIRIVQEALTNVRKHASARQAWVRFAERDGVQTVSISDDGLGFNAAHPSPGAWPGFGLQTMRERAESIGGTFLVRSGRGAGTEVVVQLPTTGGKAGRASAAGG